jgi:DNA-binding transcriptional LysR family regulator
MSARLDPYSLRLFVAVAREGSLARAAAKEHIATSALSRRIANLERLFGTALIVRSPRGITLTEAGQIALKRGLQLETELQSLQQEIQAQSSEVSGTLRLFANASAVVGFLPERLRKFCAKYPRVKVALQEASSADVLTACLDDRCDVGVAVAMEAPSGIESWHFIDDPLIVVLPRPHVLARVPSVTFVDVLKHPLVTVQSGGALDRTLHDRAADARALLQVAVTVSSFDAVCRMVEAGLGIAVVPRSAATAYAGSRQFIRKPLAEPWAGRELRLYALRKVPRPRVAEVFIATLCE